MSGETKEIMSIQERLFQLEDTKYADFQAKLTPGIERDRFIGCRVPEVRKLAKAIYKENDYGDFLKELPHKYYDEDMLHGVLLSQFKDYDKCIEEIDTFLPYVDNWAVCDIMAPVIFKKHKKELLEKIYEWSVSEHTYTCRFGLEMLMTHFLDEDFQPEFLEISTKVVSEEYYVNMMIAWFLATALAKQWESTIPYIEKNVLPKWVHNKTIQKAVESYRITEEQKVYLKSMRIKKETSTLFRSEDVTQ